MRQMKRFYPWSRTPMLQRDERGNALIIAIAAVLLVGLLMGAVFTSVMFTVGNTAATRAHAAARAAAEGGAQQVARVLLRKSEAATTSCSGLDSLGVANGTDWVDYDLLGVWFQKDEGTGWVECEGTKEIPKLAHAVRVKTEGRAAGAGVKGSVVNERGNNAVVEMTFVRPASLGLDHAVFGDSGVLSNTDFRLYPDPPHPSRPSTKGSADIVTNEQWSCPANGVITGNVYAMGNISVPTNCVIQGNLYVKGSPQIGAQLEVHGKMYVLGNLGGSKVIAHDDVLVSGNLSLSSGGHDFRGDVRVKGTFSTSDSIANSFKQTLSTGGPKGSGWNLDQTIADLGARFQANSGMTGGEWIFPTLFDTSENPATQEDRDRVAFPMLEKDMPPFNTFVARTWQDLTGRACPNTSNGPNDLVIATPTAIDLTGCGNITLGKLDIELNADLVIFTKNITNNGSWSVRTGNVAGDEQRRTFYLVGLPESGQTACASGKGGEIVFSTGGWKQTDADGKIRTKVVLYGAGGTSMSSKPTGKFTGQLYGCKVTVQSGIDMDFARGGDDFTDTLWDLGIGSVRDITDAVATP